MSSDWVWYSSATGLHNLACEQLAHCQMREQVKGQVAQELWYVLILKSVCVTEYVFKLAIHTVKSHVRAFY